MTEHTCTKHDPGTATCYCHCRCRCTPCRRTKSRAHEEWRLRKLRSESETLPSIGTVRRLRALARVGWTHRAMADELGMRRSAVTRLISGAHGHVFRSTAVAVAALADRGWNGPAVPDVRSIHRAEAAGWARMIEWDDDTIDDPNAQPWRPEGGRDRRRIDLIADAVHQGLTVSELAAELGVQPDTIYTACKRAGELDLWERLTDRSAA